MGYIIKALILSGLLLAGLTVVSAVILTMCCPKLLKEANEAKGKDEDEQDETVGIGSKL